MQKVHTDKKDFTLSNLREMIADGDIIPVLRGSVCDTVDVIRLSWGWRRERGRQDCHTEKR